MYPYKIEIDGSRVNDDQPWRVNRIYMIIGYAQALADIDKNKDYYKKISAICDYKGSLTITWITEPNEKEKEYLRMAWESIVTDYESNPINNEII